MEIAPLIKLIPKDVLPVVMLILIAYHLYHTNKAIERIEKSVSSLKEEIEELKTTTVSKEQHLHDVSGWRWEIQRLEDRIEKSFDRLAEFIKAGGTK